MYKVIEREEKKEKEWKTTSRKWNGKKKKDKAGRKKGNEKRRGTWKQRQNRKRNIKSSWNIDTQQLIIVWFQTLNTMMT